MKHLVIMAVIGILLFPGCQKPSEVEVTLDPAGESALEIFTVALGDTNIVSDFDSTAILPDEQARFAGRLTVGQVTHDGGTTVRSEVFSRAVFENRDRPVRFLGRVFGYHGMNLGAVLLDGASMNQITHRVRVRRLVGDSLVAAGVEYAADVSPYQPNHNYAWNVSSPDSIDPFTVSIVSPNEITVQSPAGGTVVRRDRDLLLRWNGSGNLSIVISGFEPVTHRVKPFLHVRPRVNHGSAVLSKRVLQLLPSRFRYYVFTFVLSSRNESTVVGGFQGRVLVQAASMYNSYVELR